MAEFVFTSPGVKFKERDLTFVTRNVGITTLGLVGETMKGPAFEPVFVQDAGEFRDRFGNQNIKRFPNGKLQYELPYVANAYLEESSQLWVTRVLGLSGYEAGTAWAIVLNAGVDPDTIVSGSTTTSTTGFTDNSYLGEPLYASGDTGATFTGFRKTDGTNEFVGDYHEFEVSSAVVDGSGEVSDVVTTLTGTSYSNYEGMVLAVIRSRGYVQDNINEPPTTVFNTRDLTISNNETNDNTGDLFGEFVLTATNSGTTTINGVTEETGSTENYTVSLDPNSSSFLPIVIGNKPKDKNTKIWVESIYPDLIKKLDGDGQIYPTNLIEDYKLNGFSSYAYGVGPYETPDNLLEATSDMFTNYKTGFKTPETPWVVSQLKGSEIDRLFKFISISDGDSANREIKISIENIRPDILEFDVIIRDFNDTDENPVILESFSKCTLIEGRTTFVGRRIGTTDGEYDLKSNYIMIQLADDYSQTAFPAGFEGYWLQDWSSTVTGNATINGVSPKIFYNTDYDENERISRVYLGLSENGYDGVSLNGTGINQNLFNFNGIFTTSGFTKSKGFHLDSGATGTYSDGTQMIGEFSVGDGPFSTISDIINPTDTYNDIKTRKFTFVPAGGFDGWNVYRDGRSNIDGFQQTGIFDGVEPTETPTNDLQAWETAINTFGNPENVTINLFSTPGINWSDHNVLIQNTLDMIENDRTDTLYIADTPDVNIDKTIGRNKQDVVAAEDIVDLLDVAALDSSYGATYFPYIQIRDTINNVNVFLPPTGEVVKAMAYTDNVKFPWFAPAGLQRGVTDARKSKYKLSLDARDVLYSGRINPMADFADSGTAIFGQKTLQVKESALDRINVRRLLLQIKVLISNIATRIVFEQNDQTTIDQFLSKANPILETIKRERGLQEFRVKMDDTNNTPETRDRNELYGEIFLKPTRAVEFLGITFTITPSGASFDEAGA